MPWEQHSFAQYVLCERTRILFRANSVTPLAHPVTGTRGLPSYLLASLVSCRGSEWPSMENARQAGKCRTD